MILFPCPSLILLSLIRAAVQSTRSGIPTRLFARMCFYRRFWDFVEELQVQNNCRLVARGRSAYGAAVAFSSTRVCCLTVVSLSHCDHRSSAYGAAVAFSSTRICRLTVFILYDRRPIRTLYRTWQFRKLFTVNARCPHNLQYSFCLLHCGSQRLRETRGAHTREQKRDFASYIVNDRITIDRPGIGFSWRRCDGALRAGQCKVSNDFQPAVPRPQNARGLECQQGL